MNLNAVWTLLLRTIRSDREAPDELRAIFRRLYLDVAWFGIVAGSSQAFLSIYVARLGATPLQLGLLSAGPAAVGLAFTLPVGHWLHDRPVGRAVFGAAVLSRINFLWWIFLPLLMGNQAQIWSYVALVLLMTIPGTLVAVGFNALYAAAVPLEWRSQVAGMRNALLSLVFVVTSLVSGFILNHTPFTLGYQIIFTLGFVGVAMSTVQLWHLRHITTDVIREPEKIRSSIGDLARPGDVRMSGLTLRTNIGLRAFTRGTHLLRLDVLRGSYGRVVAALFVFHLAQYLPLPIFPLFWVDHLHFTDWEIGLGTAAFHGMVLVGSLYAVRVAHAWGNRKLTAVGALLLSAYPLMTAFTPNLMVYIVTSLLGGVAWALMAGALGNYMLEQAPETERPAALAWYNLALNAAVLTGSLLGSALAGWMGLAPALLLAALLRALSALAIWRWR